MSADCRRCGECCRRGGPVMHLEDRLLFEKQVLAITDLVLIRKGEPVIDPRRGEVTSAVSAMLKIAGSSNEWVCRFFSAYPVACLIHEQRPLECRLLLCRAPEALQEIIGHDLLPLADTPGITPTMASIARDFDLEFPFSCFNRLISPVLNGSGGNEAFDAMVNEEMACRVSLCGNHHLSPHLEVAVLGRPFFLSASALGLTVSETSTGLRLRRPADFL